MVVVVDNYSMILSNIMYNVSPSVFEFDPNPANTHIDMTPQYQDNSVSRKNNETTWFSTTI